ncbi:exported hypothetical protein [Vibrio nigripulchritudo MADA3029]|uniref:hypothetical protein n=1 Tax=Vibrio nigripulchritudo TaxID=28173 RepID=UPI0003B1ECD5|nr:hypothetical protein [Vibrio nigripulchritudo]CCN49921.1 exported hypothetical protein [Vibrio nigripulchritudo MADA3020]CCN56437.1 exported hypothetical protein [Vibrio nigripulchritudo MADA3021]CCN62070.1 exported hypothetical protein [Vibrio nigripulchritudo MADA3029]
MKNKAKSVGLKLRSVPFAIAASLTLPTGIAYADSVTGIDAISAVAKVTSDGRNVFYVYPETQVNVTTSRTKFSHFDNRDNTLYINNNPKINTKLKEPSNVTIIENQSNQPMVIGNIEVLGKRSDILFISPSGIVCDSCNFKNAGRVTLAAGSLSNNNQEITTKNGTITIQGNGLKVVDVDVLDLVSERLVQNAEINTFAKAKKLSNGSYTIDPRGNYSASQTRLHLKLGDSIVNYQSLESQLNDGADRYYYGLQIKHPINAGSIFIQTTGSVSLANSQRPILNTKSDITIMGEHNTKSLIPFGEISVSSYGNIDVFNTKIISQSSVNVKGKNVYISPDESFLEASIEADSVIISAIKNIVNKGLITSSETQISSEFYYNNGGEIFSSKDIYINADLSMKNNNRGMIVGNNVYLSAGSEIQNGMLRPWLCKEIPTPAFGQGVHIPSDNIDLGLGAGMIVGSEVEPCPGYRRSYWNKNEREAYIFGFNIAIKSPKVINSNPKLDLFDSIQEYKLRETRNTNSNPNDNLSDIASSNEVIISAENTLQIEANSSIRNGSGTLEVLNGGFKIITPLFENHRYYIAGRTYNTSNVNEQWLAANSPIPRVLVGGNLEVEAQRFSNLAGNIEIIGGMYGSLNQFSNLGVTLRKKVLGTRIHHHSRTYCSKRIWRWCVRRSTERWTTSSKYLISLDNTDQVPAFFYLGSGAFNVSGVNPNKNSDGAITSGNITYGRF